MIVHKAGRTGAGARSAASHTAALAGSREVWAGMLRQAGAIAVRSQEQLIDTMLAASRLGPAGGAAARRRRAAAAVAACSPPTPARSRASRCRPSPRPSAIRVRERAPALAEWIGNPVDQSILAGSGLSSNGLLDWMLESDAYDAAIANVGEEWFLGRPDAAERLRHACTRLREVAGAAAKPVAVVFGATETAEPWQRALLDGVRDELVAEGLAVVPTVERAAFALGRLAPLEPRR